MKRFLLVGAVTALTALPSSQIRAQHSPNRSDIFSILATTGGYYVRTVSPKGDRITATCQLIRKGGWDFELEIYPVRHVSVKTGALPVLTLSNQWSYPLQSRSDGSFFWTAPGPAAFALFLRRASSMGWGDRFVSRELNVDFQSHGSDDAGTLNAFAHLCRLPGISPNAY
tara:strand:+ start:622 stop:1131 length:510 start_codon:yes stop_codon:yes gene_type:complete